MSNLYGILRAPPYRWSWDEILDATTPEILITSYVFWKQAQDMNKAMGNKNRSVLPTPEESAQMTDEQRRKNFERIAVKLFGVNLNTEQGREFVEKEWQAGLERRAKRLAEESAQNDNSHKSY